MAADRALIMSGFKEDCETLISRFEQADDIRFESFCEIWKDMKFSLVFTGRQTYVELLEFCEEALHISKQFLLLPPRFKERIGGLYLLYGVYYKMPLDQFKIKIKLQDWQTIVELHSEIKNGEHLDANYILCKLIGDNAFHYCLFDREFGLEKQFRVKEKQRFNPYSVLPDIKDLTQKDQILTKLSDLSKVYKEGKKALMAKTKSSTSLNLYDIDTAEQIINDIRTFEENRKNQQISMAQNIAVEPRPSTSKQKTAESNNTKKYGRTKAAGAIDTDSDESEADDTLLPANHCDSDFQDIL